MSAWVKIAFRNLFKNGRRTAATLIACALGFAAVNLFAGFSKYLYTANREAAVVGEMQGHLALFKKGFNSEGKTRPYEFLLSPKDVQFLKNAARSMPEVASASPQLMVKGLLSNGRSSSIFLGKGVEPKALKTFLDLRLFQEISPGEGRLLSDDAPDGLGVARGLAAILDLSIGAQTVAMAETVKGRMNALDAEAIMLLDISNEVLNQMALLLPFSFAQRLIDADGADRVVVYLKSHADMAKVQNEFRDMIRAHNLDYEIKTWEELTDWAGKVEGLFNVIFAFLFVIVFIIVVMSMINTMGMAVVERTREIGSLRSLGLKRRGVRVLFALEGLFIGVGGVFFGGLLTGAVRLGFFTFKPMWIPPGITKAIPLRIETHPTMAVLSAVCMLLICFGAAWFPAARAARMKVVDALGHV